MSEAKINSALVQATIDAALGVPCVYENEPPYTPQQGVRWMRCHNLPAGTDTASLGIGGLDEHLGLLQLDFNDAPGAGVAWLLGRADAVRSFFVAGRRFEYDGQVVVIRRSDRSPIRPVDGWSRVSVSVFYSSHSTRPEV